MDSSEIHENTLAHFFKTLAEAKNQPKPVIEEKVPEPQITFEDFFKAVIEEKTGNIQSPEVKEATKASMESIAEEILRENISVNLHEQPLGLFGGNASVKTQDPLTPLNQNFVTMDDLQKHYKTFIQRVQQQLSTIGGGGETHFLQLDDVIANTKKDNRVLEYDAVTKKVQFTDEIGPIEQIHFNLNHTHDEERLDGTLCWDTSDRTLNLTQPGGVTQQIGQEQHFPPVKNLTGTDIPNGTVCMFAGAEEDNNARLLAAPMIADGTYNGLYVMGVATHDIPNGEDGFVTSFGYVNDIDTSAWNKGDILYADPLVPGGMTNIKPTAPDNVVVVAAVVRKDAEFGRIMVRPTIEQKMLYGRFSSIVNHVPLLPNTAYPIEFDVTDISRGFHADGESVPDYSKIYAEESGFFKFDITISLTSTNSSAKSFYVWLRKNGVDIPLSAKRQTVSGNGTYQILNLMISTSLDNGDYIQVMYATSDTTISINAPAATAFAPGIPSATLLCTQIAL